MYAQKSQTAPGEFSAVTMAVFRRRPLTRNEIDGFFIPIEPRRMWEGVGGKGTGEQKSM